MGSLDAWQALRLIDASFSGFDQPPGQEWKMSIYTYSSNLTGSSFVVSVYYWLRTAAIYLSRLVFRLPSLLRWQTHGCCSTLQPAWVGHLFPNGHRWLPLASPERRFVCVVPPTAGLPRHTALFSWSFLFTSLSPRITGYRTRLVHNQLRTPTASPWYAPRSRLW